MDVIASRQNGAPRVFAGISNYIIKFSAKTVSPILTKLFNQCLDQGVFPHLLKIACIIPLFKSGEKSDSTNYRPISLLPLFGKIFEKIIETRLVKFLDKTKIIAPHQFGFFIIFEKLRDFSFFFFLFKLSSNKNNS